MAKMTRRGLIKRASVGAGAIGVLAAGGSGFQAVTASIPTAKAAEVDEAMVAASGPLMVVVSNPSSGKITVMHGEHEHTISNPALVRRLLSL